MAAEEGSNIGSGLHVIRGTSSRKMRKHHLGYACERTISHSRHLGGQRVGHGISSYDPTRVDAWWRSVLLYSRSIG